MIQRQSGFTLLEVLIAFMVLSFGLLGAVALQAQAKKASFDSLQRSAAISLGEDIMHRIRANDVNNGVDTLVSLYNGEFDSTDSPTPINNCYTGACTATQMAATDIENWKAAIRARQNTGALDDTHVCINITSVSNSGTEGFDVNVIITWRGRQSFTASAETEAIVCGEYGNDNDRRRLVQLRSFVLRRG